MPAAIAEDDGPAVLRRTVLAANGKRSNVQSNAGAAVGQLHRRNLDTTPISVVSAGELVQEDLPRHVLLSLSINS